MLEVTYVQRVLQTNAATYTYQCDSKTVVFHYNDNTLLYVKSDGSFAQHAAPAAASSVRYLTSGAAYQHAKSKPAARPHQMNRSPNNKLTERATRSINWFKLICRQSNSRNEAFSSQTANALNPIQLTLPSVHRCRCHPAKLSKRCTVLAFNDRTTFHASRSPAIK